MPKKYTLLFALLLHAAGAFAQGEFLIELTPMTGAMQKIGGPIPGIGWIYPNVRAYNEVNGRLIFPGGTPTPNRLYSIDVTNGSVVSNPVFPAVGGPSAVSEPQFDNTNSTLYGLYYNTGTSAYHLVTINPVTGMHTQVGTTAIAGLNGLGQGMDTYDEIHHRYIVYSTNKLFLIDAQTGNAVNTTVAMQPGDGIVQICYNNANDTLYALQYKASTQLYHLVWINPVTGTMTPAGSGTTLAAGNGSAAIDQAGRRFIYSYSNTSGFYLAVMDMDNGAILANNQVSLAPQDNFVNLKYDNTRNQLFAIHWDANTDTTVFVQSPFNDTLLCQGQTLAVPYGTIHTFKPGNVFTVQLSNASGSFASPVTIGTAAGTGPGVINCTIPPATPTGNGYRIRVVATNPGRVSQDNGVNIRISNPLAATASSNSPVCAGATLNLNTTTITGVTYSWTGPVNFTSAIQNPSRNNMTNAMAGWYVVTVNNGSCASKDSIQVVVNSVQNPTIGGTGACLGGTLNLTASTTSAGATYSWTGPNSFTSNQQNPSITGATAAAAGTYTVVITANGCSTTLTTTVSVGSVPNAPTAGSNSPVCVGQTINLTATSSTPGVSYSWTGPGSYTSTQQNPGRTNATLSFSGAYNVTAILNGCPSAPTATTVVVTAGPAAPVATNNGPLCAGAALNLSATGQTGATYQWNGSGSFTSSQQNPTIATTTTAHAGLYSVTQTIGGCTSPAGNTNVIINNSVSPTVAIYPSPNDTICTREPVTFVASPNNGGSAPQYQWKKNGNNITGATTANYSTSTIANGDIFSCELTGNAVCAVPQKVLSNNITMTIASLQPCAVSIIANPGLVLSPWQLVTFTATPVKGGLLPTYQWLRNGQAVTGATSNTWSANNLDANDIISVVLFSKDPCAMPNRDTSNTLTVNIKTGISKINGGSSISLYPNPNNGVFTIHGNINAANVSVDIVNAIGQTVYSKQFAVAPWLSQGQQAGSREFEHHIHLDVAAGVYLLKVKSNDVAETVRFLVNE